MGGRATAGFDPGGDGAMKRACLIAVALLLAGCVGAGGAPRPDFTPSQPKASGPPPYVINMWVLVCAAPEIQMQIDAPAEADPLGYWEARSGGALIRTNAPIIQRLGDPATVKVNVAEKPDPNAPAEVLFLLRCEGGRMASEQIVLPRGGAAFVRFGAVDWVQPDGTRRASSDTWYWAGAAPKEGDGK